jgi:predicted regulator of Ras-like GTPase activity (Roadblock/LC7/MglB family)
MVKKKNIQQTATAEPVIIEQTGIPSSLRNTLEEVKSQKGVIGYILRTPTSAAIDLKDPTKLTEYAILSSTVTDTTPHLADLFDLGEPKDIAVQGKDVKMLCLRVNDDKVSVFMENDANIERIIRKLTV